MDILGNTKLVLVPAHHAEMKVSGEACACLQIQVIYQVCKCEKSFSLLCKYIFIQQSTCNNEFKPLCCRTYVNSWGNK